ncbi:hypothetical protein J5N97_023489 [Dioscorea zingiberensis]|uniref:chalcone synthase n=1 Tax=Dioscorea zingiberensis TaxID=325984 RepID=A0A9D5H817_9LILI|nr:hypothetical protein J5N97_023489 [Dioscorea zingiberensis]
MHVGETWRRTQISVPSWLHPWTFSKRLSLLPKLAKQPSLKGIKEWGLPKSSITHLIFCTTSGADYHPSKLLSLQPAVNRFMLYQQGCFAGGTVIRLAKDIAKNKAGARVLVVCSEITTVTFCGPTESHLDSLVSQALFGDGAVFWIAHPGGLSILDQVEEKLGPESEKLRPSRQVLSDYGNMSSACVLFTLDEMRWRSVAEGHHWKRARVGGPLWLRTRAVSGDGGAA